MFAINVVLRNIQLAGHFLYTFHTSLIWMHHLSRFRPPGQKEELTERE
jgi:hypothetical protein